jgi:hypothetical protein
MNPNPETPKRPKLSRYYTYLTRKEAAKHLRVTPTTFWKHCEEIPSHKFDGRFFYIKEELDRLVRPCTRGGNVVDIPPWKWRNNRTYLTREEASKHLGMPESRLIRYPKYIPAYKFLNHTLYIKEELDEILQLGYHTLKSRKDAS